MTDESKWTRRLNRERAARKQAESLLESKSLELWQANQRLESVNDELEGRIQLRTRELEYARDAAEEASQAKSMFLASMSHEIRTPLNGVLGMNRLLLESELDAEQRDLAETMLSSACNLQVLLNDILDLTKFQAGKLVLEAIEFDLRALVEECCDLLAESAQTKGIELVGMVAPGTPVLRVGDAGRLRQVILNFLTNAVKFTEQGEVLLRVESAPEDPQGLRFSVTDTGIGIPEEARNGLFQDFIQVDASTSRKYGGTGLGLAISKLLAEHMQGEVGVDSTEGSGSCFWFTAQVEVCEQSSAADLADVFGNTRVIVISPSEALSDWLVQELEECGALAQSHQDPALVLAQFAEEQDCPVVLLDSAVLDPDACRQLRDEVLNNGGQVIDLIPSTRLLQRQRQKAAVDAQNGIELSKPVRRAALLASIARVKGISIGSRPSQRVAATLSELKARRVNGRRPHVLLAEDNLINIKLALKVLERLEVDVTTAVNGLKALEESAAQTFDLVLMDCQMPEMDGFESTSRIRQREYGQGLHLPIVALTANAMSGDRQRCIDSGMDDYLSKPFLPEDLLRVIDRWAQSSSEKRATG